MDTVAYYLRVPFYNTMERAIELWFDKPLPPAPDFQDREEILYYIVTIFYFVIVPLTLVLLGCAMAVDWMSATPFIFWEGEGATQAALKTVLTWNVCMLFGGLCIPFGGVVASSKRISYVARAIITHGADLVCLQEVSQDAARKLYDALKSEYRYFYFKINPDPTYSLDSGLFIASKVPLHNARLIQLPEGGTIRKAAFAFESGDVTVITTHLQSGSSPEDQAVRNASADTIMKVHHIGKRIILGDWNMRIKEFQGSPFRVLNNPLSEAEGTTCSDEPSQIDYIAHDCVPMHVTIRVGFGKDCAVSDHHALFAARIENQ